MKRAAASILAGGISRHAHKKIQRIPTISDAEIPKVAAPYAACVCGFVADDLDPRSPAFHIGHRAHHIEAYPNTPESTRKSLDLVIRLAENGAFSAPLAVAS